MNNITLVTKDNKMIEFTVNLISGEKSDLLISKIITDLYTITYSRNEQGLVNKISSNKDSIYLTYNEYDKVIRIDYDKKRYIKITYNEVSYLRLISKIEYCDNYNPLSLEVVKEVSRYEYYEELPYNLKVA